MKNIIALFLFLAVTASAQIRINLGTDATTGKRLKARLTHASIGADGAWNRMNYVIEFYELDNTTEATATGTLIQKRAMKVEEFAYELKGVYINNTTRLFANEGDVGSVYLTDYLNAKVANSYPGINATSTTLEFNRAVFREILTILQLNSLLP